MHSGRKSNLKERRRRRVKKRIRWSNRPRLVVYRSNKHIYAQVVDPSTGKILCSASTVSKELRDSASSLTKIESSGKVGALIAVKALASGVTSVVFDRNGFLYHGRIKALADSARESGLDF